MKYIRSHMTRQLALLLALMSTLAAMAFDLDVYADHSILAEGKWTKISVPESGLYRITRAQLSQWGFNDPSKVRVYGYGGQAIDQVLSLDNYTDDLPPVQSVLTDDGIVFYGVGPETWVPSGENFRISNNNYSTAGYYFITDSAADGREIEMQGTPQVNEPYDTFVDRLHYETDLVSPGEAGYLLVGENFKTQNDRKFTFTTPDRVEQTPVWMETAMVSKSFTESSFSFMVNGDKLPKGTGDRISAINNSVYLHGEYIVTQRMFETKGSNIEVKISVANVSAIQNIWLDYIAINYERRLALPSDGMLKFWSEKPALALSGTGDVNIWDVTDPMEITQLRTATDGGKVTWGNDFVGLRTYVAWRTNAKLPSPKFEGAVSHQDIHGMDNVDMVIFTLPEFISQAERVAQLHRTEQRPLKVAVLNVDQVYNEFASGVPTYVALRRCLKMFYDRSQGSTDARLQYCLLMGRSTYDNRRVTSQFLSPSAYRTIPCYIGGVAKSQLSDNTAFGTDDVLAMLGDGSGQTLGLDDLSIAIGRMPVTSLSEARSAVDKLTEYMQQSENGTWKNSMLFLADDGDNGTHVQQTEKMVSCITNTPGQQNFITKVYVDAYDIIGGECKAGREEMYRYLSDGVAWWNYCGHANNHSWTAERMLTWTDIKSMYLKKVPILMAATCDFLRWDSNTISGGEIMFHERNGGIISAISATRPVYIADNGLFTQAIGRAVSARDIDGSIQRLGDIYRIAKNNILNDKGEHRSNPNRLRYVLMGDPAMPMPTPSNIVKVETIAGEAPTSDAQVTLKALQRTEITGSICDPAGNTIEDFNGTIQITIYDAERSITTKGERDDNVKMTFEQHGEKLFSGLARVTNGRYTLPVAMPGEVADNFRPALMNMYAWSDDGRTEAVGINNDFYIYGYDDTVEPDTEAPVIHSMVLNHPSFNEGDMVNTDPMLIADISDNIGINLSGAGVGHQMVATLDGRTTYNDVSLYYTPATDGTPSGQIRFPLSNLTPGPHTLNLRVWDTAANSASRQISFSVAESLRPVIFDVYTDVNPARTEVKFFVNHNRPDAELTVTITVYDLLGHQLWETSSKGVSNMFVSAPITWDLCDMSGRRLPRGIYLYRAQVSADNGDTYNSEARRLAVTAY